MNMYKQIIIPNNSQFTEKDLLAIKYFNQSFTEDELKLEYDNHTLIALLREVDFSHFKTIALSASRLSGNGIFNNLFESIQKIKSYGIKGKKRNYFDYNKERKVKNRKEKEKRRGQYFYALDHCFSKKNNKLPNKLLNRIICDDSKNALKALPNNCIDLIFTSPPYNFGLEYEKGEDDHFWDDYFGKLFSIFDECIRVLKYGGRVIVNLQPLFSDYIPTHHIISNYFIKNKMIWKGEILWEKNHYNCKYTSWGSWKSPSSPYLKYTWEFIEIFCKGSLKKVGKKEDITLSAEEFKKWVMAKWSIAPEREMKSFGHPAMFPKELAERAIKLFSYKNDVVLDPFNGVGTTTLVAKELKRGYLGIDVSGEYCKKAEDRIEDSNLKIELL